MSYGSMLMQDAVEEAFSEVHIRDPAWPQSDAPRPLEGRVGAYPTGAKRSGSPNFACIGFSEGSVRGAQSQVKMALVGRSAFSWMMRPEPAATMRLGRGS